MKKVTLIIGKRSSGKTTKANQLLSNYKHLKIGKFVYPTLTKSSSVTIFTNYDIVCIDEIVRLHQLEALIQTTEKLETKLIAVCTIELDELPKYIMDNCEIIQCNLGYNQSDNTYQFTDKTVSL